MNYIFLYIILSLKVWICDCRHHHWQHWGRNHSAWARFCCLSSQIQGHCLPPIQRAGSGCCRDSSQQGILIYFWNSYFLYSKSSIYMTSTGWTFYRNWASLLFHFKTCININDFPWFIDLNLKIMHLLFQSIPSDMQFDPNSTPPCYKTQDEVNILHHICVLSFWLIIISSNRMLWSNKTTKFGSKL